MLGRFRLFQLGLEGLLIGRHEIDHKTRRLIVARLENEGLVDEERAAHVDDDARLAGSEQAITIGGDQPPLLLADPLGHLEIHIGRIDDHAIGARQRKDVDIDLLRQIGDEPRALTVSGDAGVLGDGGFGLGMCGSKAR